MYSQKYALSQITHVLILISQMVHEHWKDHTIEATLILCHKTEMEKKKSLYMYMVIRFGFKLWNMYHNEVTFCMRTE